MTILSKIGRNLRDYDRLRCSHDFEVYVLDSATLVASLMDISRSGCRIMVDGRIETGAFVALEFTKDAAVDASVVWTKGSVVGCKFTNPLTRISVRAILDRCTGMNSADYGYGDVYAPIRGQEKY